MNILGSLPTSTSVGGKLDSLDFAKLLRMGLVLAASGVVTFIAPKIGSFSYVWHGIDFTSVVIPATALLVEGLRRFIASSK